VSLGVYGLLTPAGSSEPTLTKTTLSSYKVDVLAGGEMWGLLRGTAKELCSAIKKRASLKIQKMPMLSTGELMWDDKRAEVGAPFDAMAEASKWLSPGAPGGQKGISLAGSDRHPSQIAEPVVLEKFSWQARSDKSGLDLSLGDGVSLGLASERMADSTDFSVDDVKRADKMIGLIRFDRGRFLVQPLAITVGGKKEVLMAGSAGASAVAGGDVGGRDSALGILRERAGKLLRKKS
jgi:hypothetical protein